MKKTILVVEDDENLLDVFTQKLNLAGFTVVPMETGQQTIDYLNKNTPDFVILDILLPDIDGVTILGEIKNNPKNKNIPVIVFSNLDQPGSFEQVAALGDYEYLVKAKTDLNDLVKKIKNRLGV